MILVTGAGGKTGRAVIAALTARGAAVHACLHRAGHEAALFAAAGVRVSVGDLEDAEALAQAAAGAGKIYHICPNVSPAEVAIGRNVIEAAQGSGVGHVVYHSVLHPQIEAMPHHWDKLRVEELLLASGLDVTILQPTAYMQNILGGWTRIVEAGSWRFPYPAATRLSLVDLDDVAEAAAMVLTTPGHEGATYELAGTPPLDQHEVAAALSEALGRPVRAEPQSLDDWEAQARAAGIGDHQRDTLAKMFRHYAQHGLAGNPHVLGWLLGRPPTTLPEFARRVVRG